MLEKHFFSMKWNANKPRFDLVKSISYDDDYYATHFKKRNDLKMFYGKEQFSSEVRASCR